MSDISIPGTSTDKNTQIIEATLKSSIEYRQKEDHEAKVELYTQQKSAWQQINKAGTTLREAARTLYSFENPFDSYTAVSSDEKILTATTTREAMEGVREIQVVKTAEADKFLSRSIDEDQRVPAGTYTFKSGEESVSFKYKGGKLPNFVQTLNRQADDVVSASLIKNTSSTHVLTIKGQETGVANRLEFLDDAFDWGLEMGILKQTRNGARDIPFAASALEEWQGDLDSSLYNIENGVLTLFPGASMAHRINPPLELQKDFVLEVKVRIETLPQEEYVPPEPPPGPSIPSAGTIDYGGVRIENESSDVPLPAWSAPSPPPYNYDLDMVYIETGNTILALDEIVDSDEEQILSIPLEALEGGVDALKLRNANTHKIIHLYELRAHNPDFRGDYEPARPVAEASDSLIILDGIEVTRENNTIEDLLPGVTLNIKKPSEEAVELTVEPDRENIKTAIINLVAYYDQMMKDILIMTSRDETVIDEIDYLEDDEVEKAREQLGVFQGDSSLSMLKSKMQTLMMNAYPTSVQNEVSMLAQLGISTNAAASSGITTSKLRGYLEIDEDALDNALETLDLEAIKELFGNDTNNDLVVDSGVAYELDNLLKAYNQTGGIIATRLSTLDTRIESSETRIENYDRQLETKRQRLQEEYGQMDAALESLESMSNSLNNLGSLNNND